MAALLMDDIPQYTDFAKRFGSYQNEPLEDPLEKLVYLADNKYWKWNQPDHLDMVISKILSRTREIDRRLNRDDHTNNCDIFANQPDFGYRPKAKKSESPEIETFMLPQVLAYMDFIKGNMKVDKSEKKGNKIYEAIREALK
jgi:hypothetical protein